MAYISKIRLTDDSILLLKDAEVRKLINVPKDESQSPHLIGALTVGEKTYNGVENVSITAADLGIEKALVFVGSYSELPEPNPEVFHEGNVVLVGQLEFLFHNNDWVLLGPEQNFKVLQTPVIDPVASQNTTTTLTYIDFIEQNANGNIAATKKEITLHQSAISGSIYDLKEAEDDCLILYCGSSTELV